MEIVKFCIEIVNEEGHKFNVGIAPTANQITASTAADINYDIAENRCAYVYRCGAINISFAQYCFHKFMTEYKDILTLLSQWMDCPNLTLCSLTNGPAFDYIALLLSCYQYVTSYPLFKNVYVISKYGAWRNTVNIIHQIISDGHLNRLPSSAIGKIDVIQGDPLMEFSQKVKNRISNSGVILMMKTLNPLADSHQEKVSNVLVELFDALKPGATLFCIDTKRSITLIIHELSKFSGNFLYGPVHSVTKLDLEYTDVFRKALGCLPAKSTRGSFFVWKKSLIELPKTIESQTSKFFKTQASETLVEDLVNVSDIKICQIHADSTELRPNSYNRHKSIASSFDYSSMSSNFVEKNFKPFLSRANFTPSFTDSVSSSQISIECDSPITTQNFSSLVSLNNEEPNCDIIRKEKASPRGGEKTVCDSSITHKSTQTEPEISSSETDSERVSSLMNRIVKLTATIKVLLQRNETQHADTKREIENKCDCSFNNYIHNRCSYNSCMHDYSHHSPHSCMCVCCTKKHFENCCHNQAYPHMRFYHNENCCSSSCCNESKFSSPNLSVTSPNLVIPLNSLSRDAISQIISLLSHCQQET